MMTAKDYERDTEAIKKLLPIGPRVAVIGSGKFLGHDTDAICAVVGSRLATLQDIVIITGGLSGVAEAVGRAYFAARQQLSGNAHIYHILPRGSGSWDYGVTLYGGNSLKDRREILGRLSAVYLSIEGGPGTAHEAHVAKSNGATIIPVGRTGGFSCDIYLQLPCPQPEIEREWELLNDTTASIELLGVAIQNIVDTLTHEHQPAYGNDSKFGKEVFKGLPNECAKEEENTESEN